MILAILTVAASILILSAYLTNPFNKWHIIRRPYIVKKVRGRLVAEDRTARMHARQWRWLKLFAIIKCGIHILTTRFVYSPRSRSRSISGIVLDIRRRRFNPERLLLTSGDHFSALFVRNLGVFYYPTLDARIKDTPKRWGNRQIVYLQTVAYALSIFRNHPVPTTTIVETGPYAGTCVNFYAYPSDTVYGMLYALAALSGKESAAPWDYASSRHVLLTQELAERLTRDYGDTLHALYAHYRQIVLDEKTGLVSASIHLSGAKDITRRHSAFYDNVIFWKTTQLAMQFGLIGNDTAYLSGLKDRILKTFWLEGEGYFLEDLSKMGLQNKYYSSDWLIVLATGFLDPMKSKERDYFERSVAYIRSQGIDRPFPIKYQQDTRAHRQFLAVRLAVASYGGDAIWSFWGMEYIKVLLRLYGATGSSRYLEWADSHIQAYQKAMRRDGGFPEVYDSRGTLLETLLYRSIRQTGWVIGFEQVLSIRSSIVKN